MAFDAVAVRCLVKDLKDKLINSRIDKIHQPEKDEIVLQMRSREGGKRLLINAGSAAPRICFTDAQKENPAVPPMLCMLLRMHIRVFISQTFQKKILSVRLCSVCF